MSTCEDMGLAGVPCDKTLLGSGFCLKPALFVLGKSDYSLQRSSLHPIICNRLSRAPGKAIRGQLLHLRTHSGRTFPTSGSPARKRSEERAFGSQGRRGLTVPGDTHSPGAAEALQRQAALCHTAPFTSKLLFSTHCAPRKDFRRFLVNKMRLSCGVFISK